MFNLLPSRSPGVDTTLHSEGSSIIGLGDLGSGDNNCPFFNLWPRSQCAS